MQRGAVIRASLVRGLAISIPSVASRSISISPNFVSHDSCLSHPQDINAICSETLGQNIVITNNQRNTFEYGQDSLVQ